MFKQILKFFCQKNNSEPSPIAQTKELPLEQLKHNLALLKEREAKYGDEVTKQLIADLEEELLHLSSTPSPQMLEAMTLKILMAQQRLSVLVQRNIHQGNLNHLEKQVAPEGQFSTEALQLLLEPDMGQLQEEIRLLAEKSPLSSSEQIILQNYRHNLKLYQEMLTGKRRYAPVHIWRQIEVTRESILELEASLAKNETI